MWVGLQQQLLEVEMIHPEELEKYVDQLNQVGFYLDEEVSLESPELDGE